MTDTLVVGVDIGGTNIRVAAWNRNIIDRAGTNGPPPPLAKRRELVGVERRPGYVVDHLCRMITEVVRDADTDTDGAQVGVGIAAMLRGTDGFVVNSPHLRWRDVGFGQLLRERLGPDYPVVIENDVNAITYGEYRCGAGVGADDILAVFVGTGIGAGIIAGGRLVGGAANCAGELGHVTVIYGDDALPCACGLRGCVEAYIGGAYLQRRIRAELAGGARSIATRLAGDPSRVTPGHLDQAAAEGDDYALSLFAEIAPLLGVALANALTLLNPARLILGGGVLSRTPILREHVVTSLEIAANPPALASARIVDAALGDDAGVVGSALLAAAAELDR